MISDKLYRMSEISCPPYTKKCDCSFSFK